VQQACGANNNIFNIKAVFSYDGAAPGNPATVGATYTQGCADESKIVPVRKEERPFR